jgi:hypothetical protein
LIGRPGSGTPARTGAYPKFGSCGSAVRVRCRPEILGGRVRQKGGTPAERVWVTGHWRNQPYELRRALRRPTYIHPFLRGPEDAPIKLSTTVRILSDGPLKQGDN